MTFAVIIYDSTTLIKIYHNLTDISKHQKQTLTISNSYLQVMFLNAVFLKQQQKVK